MSRGRLYQKGICGFMGYMPSTNVISFLSIMYKLQEIFFYYRIESGIRVTTRGLTALEILSSRRCI